jgi:hypothetical protein
MLRSRHVPHVNLTRDDHARIAWQLHSGTFVSAKRLAAEWDISGQHAQQLIDRYRTRPQRLNHSTRSTLKGIAPHGLQQ